MTGSFFKVGSECAAVLSRLARLGFLFLLSPVSLLLFYGAVLVFIHLFKCASAAVLGYTFQFS